MNRKERRERKEQTRHWVFAGASQFLARRSKYQYFLKLRLVGRAAPRAPLKASGVIGYARGARGATRPTAPSVIPAYSKIEMRIFA